MASRERLKKKKTAASSRVSTKAAPRHRPPTTGATAGPRRTARHEALYGMLTTKRQELMNQIGESIGQSLTADQQRRLEAAMDVGDQALMDVDRELGISLLEMRNRRRQLIDEALARLADGTYGLCAECGVEISEKRLAVVPFAKLCVDCQSRQELLEKIEKEEERD